MRATLKLVLIVALLSLSLSGQTPSQTVPDPKTPPVSLPKLTPALWEQYAAYWTAEPGWKTEIHLRNNLPSQTLTVTPTLRAADGTESKLPAVKISPNDVVTVDLGPTITSAAPQLAGGYGSIVLRYTAPVGRALYAAVIVQLPGTPIEFHLDAFPQAPKAMTGGREGIWWLPRDSAKDWLVVANTSDSALAAWLTLYGSSGKAWRQALKLGPRETTRLSVRSLVQQGGLAGSFGGISLDAGPRAADLDSAHFVYDETTGFLALMKMFDRNTNATLSERSLTNSQWTIRAPMLPLMNPDPALALPEGTTLKPAIFLRNASGKGYTAQVTFHWRSGTTTGKSTTAVPLQPYMTTTVDVAALQANGTIPASAQWAYVNVTAPIKPDDLLAVATSFDATGRLGAQTPFTDQAANHWEGGMWEVDPNHDTIIAVGNAGNTASDARITLFYNSGQGKYQIDQTLAQDEQVWLDIGKLVRNQVPDVNGTTIPLTVMSGSYQLKSLTDKPTDGLFEGKLVVDKTYGYAVHGCASCCPEYDPYILADPLNLTMGGSSYQAAWSYDNCSGNTVQLSASNWGTGSAQVATANITSGLVSAVGLGSTTNFASVRTFYPNSRGYCTWSTVQRSSTVNVSPSVTISGPLNVAMRKAGTSQGSNSVQLTATNLNPSGGTFLWSAVSGAGNVQLSGTTSQTVTVQSVAVGTATIQVQYTVNTHSSTAITVLKIQQPGSLGVLSNLTAGINCSSFGGWNYNTQNRQILYDVLDGSGAVLPAANMFVQESLSFISNGCNLISPDQTSGLTNSDGSFPNVDKIQACSPKCPPADKNLNPTGSCTTTTAQTWTANGYTVKSATITQTCPGPPTGVP
jgi:hypothetical protein